MKSFSYSYQFSKEKYKEINLILACAVSRPSKDRKRKIANAISSDLDWDFIYNNAIKNRIYPLIYNNLISNYKNQIPKAFVTKLKQVYYFNTAHCMKISHELFKIINLSADAKIKVIPFKGATLAGIHYGDESFRTYGDVDLLIQRKDLKTIYKLLIKNGYRLVENLNSNNLSEYLKFENSINFISPGSNLPIEIHWELMGIYLRDKIRFNDLNEVKKIEYKHNQILQLKNEDYLLYLFLHGNKHSWQYLDLVCSASELIQSQKNNLNWELIRETSRHYKVNRILNIGILLTHNLINTPISEKELYTASKDKKACRLYMDIAKKFFHQEKESIPIIGSNRYSLFHLRTRENFSDKLAYFAKLFFHPSSKEIALSGIPNSIHFLYGLKRFRRLISEAAVNFFR